MPHACNPRIWGTEKQENYKFKVSLGHLRSPSRNERKEGIDEFSLSLINVATTNRKGVKKKLQASADGLGMPSFITDVSQH